MIDSKHQYKLFEGTAVKAIAKSWGLYVGIVATCIVLSVIIHHPFYNLVSSVSTILLLTFITAIIADLTFNRDRRIDS